MMLKRRPFTLLEIVICLAILGLGSATIGVQIQKMVADHTFSNNVMHLFTELKKCQLIAACDQTDIEVVIAKEGKGYGFFIQTDDPLTHFVKKKGKLPGVHSICKNGKRIQRETLHFYPSGRFKQMELQLSQNEGRKCHIVMEPSIIELKGENS